MWVRVTCPNGHRLKIDTKFLGRSNRCPKCAAHVYLWIEVTCSHGHSLKVRSLHAGKRGRCPVCGDWVHVPDITEALALDTIIGHDANPAAPPGNNTTPVEPSVAAEVAPSHAADAAESQVVGSSALVHTKRLCPNCNDEIPRSYRTCPLCNHYIGDGLGETLRRNVALRCPECGQVGFPGETICSTCGTPLIGGP